jgi:hypothetical protein
VEARSQKTAFQIRLAGVVLARREERKAGIAGACQRGVTLASFHSHLYVNHVSAGMQGSTAAEKPKVENSYPAKFFA